MDEGVLQHEEEKAYKGYTLFSETFGTPWSEDQPARNIYLIDMEGRVVHQWEVQTTLQSYCRLLPDGNLIYPTHDRSDVASGKVGLYEITPESQVVWHYRCRTDHDFQILEDGHFLINTITEYMTPALGPELKRHPYIVETNRDKELVWEWRGDEHLEELQARLTADGWDHLMERARGDFAFDWAHNNTVQIIPPNDTHDEEVEDGKPPRFKPGNFFISYRSVDVIAVVERPSGRIVWAWGPGILDGQHKPHMLKNGNVLIFDNGALRGYSRVIELNPLTEEVEWEYKTDPPEDFFSPFISGAQRLQNGNTLICEGANGRLFEVTPGKEIVWEFANPYHSEESRPNVYRCLRYSEDYVQPLLERIDET
ncbi:MAG: aryl-sulfate sulfotransferase [Planctomycetes bacterium]|nr:aryl-sulfate sulfotransferase [Planctomycetota bacterium]